jgi:hypothetical protein
MQQLAQETGIDFSDAAMLGNLPAVEPGEQDTFPEGQEAPQEPEPKPATATPKAGEPAVPGAPKGQEHHVPLATYLTEREEKAQLKRQLDELLAQRRQQEQKQTEEAPDPFLDPAGFARWQARHEYDDRFQRSLNPVLEQFRVSIAHNNRAVAHSVYGEPATKEAIELFDKEMPANVADAAAQVERLRVLNSPNPFLAAVEWHQRRQVLAEVGNDPKAYRERVLAEALADPDFLGRAIEAARPVAAANPGQPQPARASAKQLPSLNRAGSGAGAAPVRAAAESDDELLNWATNLKSARPT